jgi:hypothetical protein
MSVHMTPLAPLGYVNLLLTETQVKASIPFPFLR